MIGSRAQLHVALVVALVTAACSAVTTVRVQPENVAVSPGLRPVAAIQVNATSAYFLFIPLPGGVDLDRIVNRMLIVTAKMMGADKIANLQFDITPDSGIWTLRKLLGWRSAQASGIAVQVEAPADPAADDGPEPATPPSNPTTPVAAPPAPP
jgi:hypothetical protein